MIDKLQHAAGEITALLKQKPTRKLLLSDFNKQLYLNSYVKKVDGSLKWKALRECMNWFKTNQDAMADEGFGTYYLSKGWTSSYPETSGYIVPTLLRFTQKESDMDLEQRARMALNWLLEIQKPSGGWQAGYVHQNHAEIVFNTGQVIRGMLAGYKHFQAENYLESAKRAADWLVHVQAENGAFKKHVYMDVPRVYDSYVVAPVLDLNEHAPNDRYVDMARKNIDWIISEKQQDNGWFADCDNTVQHNNRPIIHTIAYTIDGILDCALHLNNKTYLEAAMKPARTLAEIFLKDGILNGRYDKDWTGSEGFITTGGAQLAIVWYKLYKKTNDAFWKDAFTRMNALLTAIQQRGVLEERETKGALFGSFPVWGRYERFGCPNWATKYFADSLMNEADA